VDTVGVGNRAADEIASVGHRNLLLIEDLYEKLLEISHDFNALGVNVSERADGQYSVLPVGIRILIARRRE
jgi:hypothetical protein